MTGNTHVIGGLVAGLAVARFTELEPVLLMGAGVVGALIPDICHGGSWIGKKLPVLSKIFQVLFGHRSFTHSILFLLIVKALLQAIHANEAIVYGLLAGMVSHLLLDMATKNGIKLFFPISIRIRLPLTIRTGSKWEDIIFAVLSLMTIYFGYEVFLI